MGIYIPPHCEKPPYENEKEKQRKFSKKIKEDGRMTHVYHLTGPPVAGTTDALTKYWMTSSRTTGRLDTDV